MAFRLGFADGRRGLFAERAAPGEMLRFADVETDGQAAYVELDAGGALIRSFVARGATLRFRGRSVGP